MRLFPALLLPLAACGPATEPRANSVNIDAAAVQAQDSIDDYAANTAAAARAKSAAAPRIDLPPPTVAAVATPIDAAPPPDDRSPIPDARTAPDSAQAAADVVKTYYALLGEKKYRQAWMLWGHGGEDSGMSARAFAASFDRYTDYRGDVGAPGAVDAGMSQRWVTVPVQVHGRVATGKPVDLRGSITLHRIVPGVGGDPADEAWHIRTADIEPHPAG